jgi:hypothetical protein
VRLLVRTASNSYFPQVVSALSIPDPAGDLSERVRSVWDVVKTATKELLPAFRQIEKVRIALDGFTDEQVLQAAKAISADKPVSQGAIRTAEFKQFVSSKPEAAGDLPPIGATFFARGVKPKQGLPPPDSAENRARSAAAECDPLRATQWRRNLDAQRPDGSRSTCNTNCRSGRNSLRTDTDRSSLWAWVLPESLSASEVYAQDLGVEMRRRSRQAPSAVSQK